MLERGDYYDDNVDSLGIGNISVIAAAGVLGILSLGLMESPLLAKKALGITGLVASAVLGTKAMKEFNKKSKGKKK